MKENMFSGIIEHTAKIISIESWRFTIENTFGEPLKLGQSIAHDGACMTLESFDDNRYTFFAMQESLNRTNFWGKQVWDIFNVERCLRVWDRIDGHFVTGHIDTIWKVSVFEQNSDESWRLWISFDSENSKYVVEKWSISINWVSLTVVSESSGYLEVCIIPLTLEITNLWKLSKDSQVNLEFDMLGKYVLKNNKK